MCLSKDHLSALVASTVMSLVAVTRGRKRGLGQRLQDRF